MTRMIEVNHIGQETFQKEGTMTLIIRNIKTNKVFEYHYQDAIIDGNVVYLGRQTNEKQMVWNREDVEIEATEGDKIFIRDANTGELRSIR